MGQLAALPSVLGFFIVPGDYKLQALLEIRASAVQAAECALRDAMLQLAEHEAEQRRLSVRAQATQAQLQLLTASVASRTASAFQAKDRYAAQLRAELIVAQQALSQHESVVLANALRLEQQARDDLRTAKQEATLINRHRENADKATRKEDERRADGETDDWTLGRLR